jgi:hypothetical protein
MRRPFKVEAGVNTPLRGRLRLLRFSLDQASPLAGDGRHLLRSSAVRLFFAPSANAKLKRVILCRDMAKTPRHEAHEIFRASS